MLPNVSQLVMQIKECVAEEEAASPPAKEAATPPPTWTVPVARELFKFAVQLRQEAATSVSMGDVHEFADRIMEQHQ